MILSVDPGEHVGLAVWTDDGQYHRQFALSFDEFVDWCDAVDINLSTIVYEDFTLRRNRANAQTGSKMQAAQAIGVVKLLAKKKGAVLVRQQPDILRITALHAGISLPQGHIPDDVSAYLHGFHYLEQQGIIKPIAQR